MTGGAVWEQCHESSGANMEGFRIIEGRRSPEGHYESRWRTHRTHGKHDTCSSGPAWRRDEACCSRTRAAWLRSLPKRQGDAQLADEAGESVRGCDRRAHQRGARSVHLRLYIGPHHLASAVHHWTQARYDKFRRVVLEFASNVTMGADAMQVGILGGRDCGRVTMSLFVSAVGKGAVVSGLWSQREGVSEQGEAEQRRAGIQREWQRVADAWPDAVRR